MEAKKPVPLAGERLDACSSACSSACHPLWIECRGVETAHWARMFAIHSGQNAAAICPQLTATAVICSSSLLQPTNPLEPVETLPLNPPLCCSPSAAQRWSGLEDYHLTQYLCSSPNSAKKEFWKWPWGNFLPTFDSENPKTLFALKGMRSSQMPCPYQRMHGKPAQGQHCSTAPLKCTWRCCWTGKKKRIALHCGWDSCWQIGRVWAEHRWQTKPEHCGFECRLKKNVNIMSTFS